MNPNVTRRNFMTGGALLAGARALPDRLAAQSPSAPAGPPAFDENDPPAWTKAPLAPGEPGRDYRPTLTLNGSTMPYRVVGGAKVFHLTCEEVDHVFVPATKANGELRAFCWGFNGQVHGPTIECVEG